MANVTTPPIQKTVPEVFILESLTSDNEESGLFEGRILYRTLKMGGKNPKYYYFRTVEELEILALMYRESGYRYLHFSSHGDLTHIHTTLGRVSYSDFAQIFKGHLRNRRLFMSACQTGNQLFSECVAATNKGMYSVSAPVDKIGFDEALAIWIAFYTKAYLIGQDKMKTHHMFAALQKLCKLFEVNFHWSGYNPKKDEWTHRTLS